MRSGAVSRHEVELRIAWSDLRTVSIRRSARQPAAVGSQGLLRKPHLSIKRVPLL